MDCYLQLKKKDSGEARFFFSMLAFVGILHWQCKGGGGLKAIKARDMCSLKHPTVGAHFSFWIAFMSNTFALKLCPCALIRAPVGPVLLFVFCSSVRVFGPAYAYPNYSPPCFGQRQGIHDVKTKASQEILKCCPASKGCQVSNTFGFLAHHVATWFPLGFNSSQL